MTKLQIIYLRYMVDRNFSDWQIAKNFDNVFGDTIVSYQSGEKLRNMLNQVITD